MPLQMRPWILFVFYLLSLIFPPSLASQVLDVWTNLGIYGGHIQDIAIDPKNPSRIFAATYMGRGLYLSQDDGATWQALEMDNAIEGEDTFKEQTVYTVAIAPSDSDIIWVGHNYWLSKSMDGGQTWEHIANKHMQTDCLGSRGPDDNWRLCRSVAIDPFNPDVVYVGTSGPHASDTGGAVYVTQDGGITWRKLNQGVDLDFGIEDIAVSPDQPDTVWAATNANGSNNIWDGTIYYSQNSGNRFSALAPKPVTGAILAVAPKPDDADVVFAASQWGIVQLAYKNGQWQASYPVSGCRAATDIVFAPSNADVLYASWMRPKDTVWKGDGLPKLSRGVWDGSTWAWDTFTLSSENANALIALAVHPDEPETIIAGDNGLGILGSDNGGERWGLKNKGLDAVIVYDLDVADENSGHMLAASGSGLYERMDSTSPWVLKHNGDFRAVHFQPFSSNTYYAGGYGFVARTTDNGDTWSYSADLGFNYVADIAIDSDDLNRLYITTGHYGQKVLRSTDGGDTFQIVLNGINKAGQKYSMNKVVIDPHDQSHLLAAGGNFNSPYIAGDLWESFDGGDTWQRTGLTDTVVNTVIIDPIHENILYAGCGYSRNDSDPIVKSMDAGATWQASDSGMPPPSVALHGIWGPTDSEKMYIVGHSGYITKFDGQSWESMNSGTQNDLYGVFGLHDESIYAVGSEGTILRYNGQAWQRMQNDATTALYKVWAADIDDIFAVGQGGRILHYDGTNWKAMPSPTEFDLYEVYGLASNNVFAAGENGTLLHYDGHMWQAMAAETNRNLNALWPVNDNEIIAVGDEGLILRYCDTHWSFMDSGVTGSLTAIWGRSADDVYAAGTDGLLVHFDGHNWFQVDLDINYSFQKMWGSGSDKLFFTDSSNAIWLYDGQKISKSRQAGTFFRSVTDLAFNNDNPDIIYAASYQAGVYISPNQGDDWMNLGTPTNRVFALASGSLFAATGSGMYQLTGTGVITGQVNDAETLTGIDNAMVVTDLGHRCKAIDGSYMMVVPAGIYDLYALADNFGMESVEAVTVIGSEITQQDFELAPDKINQNVDTGGSDGNGKSSGSSGYCFIATLTLAD